MMTLQLLNDNLKMVANTYTITFSVRKQWSTQNVTFQPSNLIVYVHVCNLSSFLILHCNVLCTVWRETSAVEIQIHCKTHLGSYERMKRDFYTRNMASAHNACTKWGKAT